MFKSKRSGLVRRLWRSRLVTESDGRDGGRRGEAARHGHSGRLHRHEQRSVTRSDAAPGLSAEAGDMTETIERDEEEQSDDDRGVMCVAGRRSSLPEQEGDGRTVTCCLFGEWDLRPRSSYWALRKDAGAPCQCAPRRTGLEEDLASTAHAFLKRLKDRSLDALVKAVETKGGVPGECVTVPRTDLRLGGHHVSPQYLLCRLFRWSDLPLSARLKALCHCQSFGSGDSAKVCCNPYHYSRLCGPESPPPPYSQSRSDEHKLLDTTDSALSYTETAAPLLPSPPHIMPRDYTDTGTSIGSSTSGGHRSHWCSVAYWEQRTRVGRLYPAYEPSLSIFYDLPQGTGLCLGQLHGSGSGGNVQQIRSKIGFGIVLSLEADGVWVYNRSQHPVFVHSPTLDLPSARGLSVRRVMPGFSLKVFDFECSSWMTEHGVKPETQEGPWDPHSIRISFAKGWGPCYSRQFITSCPCWLEVLLNTHR
uniref:Mothers against decapentaplegic homolog n=1 Tax=Poecilia formosa TaxID=48698 RepID=A0A096LQ85_POEFO